MFTDAGREKLRLRAFRSRGFTDDDALLLMRGGLGLEDLCIRFQVEPRVIRRIAARYDLPRYGSLARPSPWNDEKIATLCREWAAGTSTVEIGRLIGLGKNAVVGKAFRLDLPPRENPIFPDKDGSPKRVRKLGKRGPYKKIVGPERPLKPLPKLVEPPPAPKPRIVAPPPPPPPPAPEPPRRGKITECSWPCGTPKTRDFHYCDEPSEPGRPYCAKHDRLARQAA